MFGIGDQGGTSDFVQFAAHDNGVAFLADDFDQTGEIMKVAAFVGTRTRVVVSGHLPRAVLLRSIRLARRVLAVAEQHGQSSGGAHASTCDSAAMVLSSAATGTCT